MKYTLFIDESGDFKEAPRWIVSGVLCQGNPESAEKEIKNALYKVQIVYRLNSCADFHLTELRKRFGTAKALTIAESVFSLIASKNIVVSMLVVENSRKQGLKESERTYRMMLLDLLALADTSLPESYGNQQLEVVIARRQKDGVLMSTRNDMLVDVVHQIEDAVEAGLAARGLLDRLGANHVLIRPAADSFGLAVADFVANLSYNRHHPESGWLFNSLEESGKIRLFEGLGGYAERRARIAERDGDLVTSLARWVSVGDNINQDENSTPSIKKIWKKVLTTRGSHGPEATLESVIEKLWRQHKNAPESYANLLEKLEKIESVLSEEKTPPEIAYRLRNFMHMLSNQIGNLESSDRITRFQKQVADSIASNPSKFHLILEHQVLSTVTEELRLDFIQALKIARNHFDLIEQYKTVWELLIGEESGNHGFIGSKLWIRTRMTLLRSLLAVGGEENLSEIQNLLTNLQKQNLDQHDLARLKNYQIWADIRSNNTERGVERSIKVLNESNDSFSLQFAIRALADAVLYDVAKEAGKSVLPLLRERIQDLSGSPADLILRDMALMELHLGRGKKVALRCLKNSIKTTESLPASPLNEWKLYLAKVHFITVLNTGEIDSSFLSKNVLTLKKSAESLLPNLTPLQAHRRVSPC